MNITTGKQQKPRRVLLYGVEGVGKSSFAAQAGAVFIPTEDGTGDLDVARFPVATSVEDVISDMRELYDNDHEYEWLALDTVDWLESFIHNEIATNAGKNNIGDIDFGKGYDRAIPPLCAVLKRFDRLRGQGMNIMLIAHAESKTFKDPERESYDRYQPKLHHKATSLLVEWCDEVLFAGFKTLTRSDGEHFGKTTYKAIGEGQRVLWTNRAKPTAIAKNRLGMPSEIPLDFNEFSKYL